MKDTYYIIQSKDNHYWGGDGWKANFSEAIFYETQESIINIIDKVFHGELPLYGSGPAVREDTVVNITRGAREEHISAGQFFDEYMKRKMINSKPSRSSKVNAIDHPSHYTFGKFEVIDVLQDWFDCDPLLWQVGKYIARAGRKGSRLEDLQKAEWYLKRRIDLEKNITNSVS